MAFLALAFVIAAVLLVVLGMRYAPDRPPGRRDQRGSRGAMIR